MPIASDLKAPTLLGYLKQILFGLIERNITVISYACDGTEVECSVQRLLTEEAETYVEHTIPSPRPGVHELHIKIPIFLGQPVTMIQDSKHVLKTFWNNLFSGARLLTFGNHAMFFAHIRDLANENGSPLYKRDVEKVDRQDDNAATRLFSADTLQFLGANHPEWTGTIIYLFIFGELVDAYQNRSIPHEERVKMVLRTRYYLDAWEAFLEHSQYSSKQYLLSREAIDITHIVIEGYLSLLYIHCDHLPELVPLLPWLHSSEACEHIFGIA